MAHIPTTDGQLSENLQEISHALGWYDSQPMGNESDLSSEKNK